MIDTAPLTASTDAPPLAPPSTDDELEPPKEMEILLETRGLVKSYGHKQVVRRVDMTIGKGEVVGLLGPNGAGKTTTFRMVIGIISPDEGQVFHRGENITRLPMYKRAQRGIGYLTQDPSVFSRMTVENNIRAILETLGLSRPDRRRRLNEYLELMELTPFRKQKAADLSGGQRRRLEVARALVTNPALLLLDEPFVGIDPIAIGDIKNIVRALKQRGISILITDHNVKETLSITDRTYIIREGAILFQGTPLQAVQNPDVMDAYLTEDVKEGIISGLKRRKVDKLLPRPAAPKAGPQDSAEFAGMEITPLTGRRNLDERRKGDQASRKVPTFIKLDQENTPPWIIDSLKAKSDLQGDESEPVEENKIDESDYKTEERTIDKEA
ncbi:MAG: LPS export ABC transporter ATP-binding protein [Planctomycetes bacterium]|nr:LPS export ABC transporter ATP-binding protein [Planctomycetota bacterium]